MKLSDQLITRVNSELGLEIPLGTKLKYLNPTINQQARGSFMWVFDSATYCRYGSTVGIRVLLKSNVLEKSYSTHCGLSGLPASLIDILPV